MTGAWATADSLRLPPPQSWASPDVRLVAGVRALTLLYLTVFGSIFAFADFSRCSDGSARRARLMSA
jgi:hypothetical protein